jgi:hypothetical protein
MLSSLAITPHAPAELGPPLVTNHYRIRTDVDSNLAMDLSHRMDVMFDEYSRRLVDFNPPESDGLFNVYIFEHREEYLDYTHHLFPNTGGVFISGRALAAFLEGQGPDQLRRTLQHEAFHQFAYSAIGRNLPVWLNEGLAQVFEEGIYDGHSFRIGQVPPRRVRQLQYDVDHNQIVDFRDLMSMSETEWHKNMADKERGTTQYNQSWAMVQYLIFAEDAPGKPRFRSRLIDMLKLVHAGKNGHDSFVEAFSDNIDGFQQMFINYARQIHSTPAAMYIEHQDILADMMINLKARGKMFKEMANLRHEIERGRYQVDYTLGPLKWTSGSDPSVYFQDLDGREFDNDHLYLQLRNGAPLPDIISRPTEGLQLHTRFTQAGDKIVHEIIVESPG